MKCLYINHEREYQIFTILNMFQYSEHVSLFVIMFSSKKKWTKEKGNKNFLNF